MNEMTHVQKWSLRNAREEAENCLEAISLNFSTVYARIFAGLSCIRTIDFHLECAGKNVRWDERGIFKDIDALESGKKFQREFIGDPKIVNASPKTKKKMLREIVEYCSQVIALSAQEHSS